MKNKKPSYFLLVALCVFVLCVLIITIIIAKRNKIWIQTPTMVVQREQESNIIRFIFYKDHLKVATQIFHPDGTLIKQDGYIPDGIVYEYDSAGSLKTILYYKNNGSELLTKKYNENGLLESETQVIKSKKEEKIRLYHPNGLLKSEQVSQNDKKIFQDEYDENGILLVKINKNTGLKREFLYPSYELKNMWLVIKNKEKNRINQKRLNNRGILIEEKIYKEDLQKITENKNNAEIYFLPEDGLEEGIVREYYPNGILKSEKNYIKGVLEGITLEYYETGILKSAINYSNNMPIKTIKWYAKNGKRLR